MVLKKNFISFQPNKISELLIPAKCLDLAISVLQIKLNREILAYSFYEEVHVYKKQLLIFNKTGQWIKDILFSWTNKWVQEMSEPEWKYWTEGRDSRDNYFKSLANKEREKWWKQKQHQD